MQQADRENQRAQREESICSKCAIVPTQKPRAQVPFILFRSIKKET